MCLQNLLPVGQLLKCPLPLQTVGEKTVARLSGKLDKKKEITVFFLFVWVHLYYMFPNQMFRATTQTPTSSSGDSGLSDSRAIPIPHWNASPGEDKVNRGRQDTPQGGPTQSQLEAEAVADVRLAKGRVAKAKAKGGSRKWLAAMPC